MGEAVSSCDYVFRHRSLPSVEIITKISLVSYTVPHQGRPTCGAKAWPLQAG